jgi:hypothetical protein
VQQVIGDCSAPGEGREETDCADTEGFFPVRPQHRRVELGACKEREEHGTRRRQEPDPGLVRSENGAADERAQEELGDHAHDDFRQGGGDAQADREERGHEGQPEPERGKREDVGHGCSSNLAYEAPRLGLTVGIISRRAPAVRGGMPSPCD